MPGTEGIDRHDKREEHDPLDGTPYRFVSFLGRGGMGEVVEAEHVDLGMRVAVKLLRQEHFARFDFKDRMRIEAQACARIRHENLVPVFDFGETYDGRTFLVMERLRGRSLAEELRERGCLPVAEAVDIARQALAGLVPIHAAGIVHRDLKPANLFLSDEPDGVRRVKVVDFGIAKILEAAGPEAPAPLAAPTAEGVIIGTPRWASPEQGRGERAIDPRSDVYSMGWVLHAMLTGRVPFPDHSGGRELSRAHAAELPPLPSAVAPQPVPRGLDVVVLRAIAKRREDRFQSAQELRDALEPFVGWTVPTGDDSRAPLIATVPLGPAPEAVASPEPRAVQAANGSTVDAVRSAISRPPLPWGAGLPPGRGVEVTLPQREVDPHRTRARLPLWFVIVMSVSILGALSAILARLLLR